MDIRDTTYCKNLFSFSSLVEYRAINMQEYASVLEFLSSYVNIDSLRGVDVYIVNGCLLKENKPAYALYYDGDESDCSFSIEKNSEYIVNTRVFNKPTILLSANIMEDTVLLETTLIHEFCHFLDGVSEGEAEAQKLELEYLCDIHGFSEDAAFDYLHKKYF